MKLSRLSIFSFVLTVNLQFRFPYVYFDINIFRKTHCIKEKKYKPLICAITKRKSLKQIRAEYKNRSIERRSRLQSEIPNDEIDLEFDHFDKNILPHLTRYQKACLRWVMDEERGNLATKAPVLYANLNFTDLKDRYPGKQKNKQNLI